MPSFFSYIWILYCILFFRLLSVSIACEWVRERVCAYFELNYMFIGCAHIIQIAYACVSLISSDLFEQPQFQSKVWKLFFFSQLFHCLFASEIFSSFGFILQFICVLLLRLQYFSIYLLPFFSYLLNGKCFRSFYRLVVCIIPSIRTHRDNWGEIFQIHKFNGKSELQTSRDREKNNVLSSHFIVYAVRTTITHGYDAKDKSRKFLTVRKNIFWKLRKKKFHAVQSLSLRPYVRKIYAFSDF